jgi:LPS-assembly protein
VPVFYLPFIYYPLDSDERSTGFLMPQYTSTSFQGHGFGNAFFWAIDRSQDATFYHNWYSKAGQSYGAEYRYAAAPGSAGTAQLTVLENVSATTRRRYLASASVNQRVSRSIGLIGRMSYTSDQLTQQLYQQNLYDLSNRERYGGATLTGRRGRYSLLATGELRERFDGLNVIRQGLAPSVSFTIGESPIAGSPVYVGLTSDAVSFVREGDFGRPDVNRSVFRVDLSPTIRAPLSRLSFLSLTTSAAVRLTHWTKRDLDPDPSVISAVDGPLTRRLVELRADLVGPTFEKVWSPSSPGFADRYKHIIQPRVGVAWLSEFDRRDEVVKNDGIDDMVGGTTTVNYGLTNRWLARRPQPGGGRGPSRSILDVSVYQSYYTNALAAAFDPNSQTTTPSPFSPVSVRANLTPIDRFNARFQMEIDSDVLRPRRYSAAAAFFSTRTNVGIGWTKTQFLPGVPGYDNPDGDTHALNWSLATGTPGGRIHGTYMANMDVKQLSMLQQRIVLSLNAQCCGVTLDYQILQEIQFGATTLPADRRFGISFSLAGLGSFSNPFGSFGDNSGRR